MSDFRGGKTALCPTQKQKALFKAFSLSDTLSDSGGQFVRQLTLVRHIIYLRYMKYSFRLSDQEDKTLESLKNHLYSKGIIKSDSYTDVIKIALVRLLTQINTEITEGIKKKKEDDAILKDNVLDHQKNQCPNK